jgi:hypothetical protein
MNRTMAFRVFRLGVSLVVLLSLVWILGSQVLPNPFRIPITTKVKLCDTGTIGNAVIFICPDARSYSLLLSTTQALANIDGEIAISFDGTNAALLQIRPTTLKACNWLMDYSLPAFIICTKPQGPWELKAYLEPRVAYTLKAHGLPEESSIWLVYRRPWRPFMKKPVVIDGAVAK